MLYAGKRRVMFVTDINHFRVFVFWIGVFLMTLRFGEALRFGKKFIVLVFKNSPEAKKVHLRAKKTLFRVPKIFRTGITFQR